MGLWIEKLGLSQYVEIFAQNLLCGMDVLDLTDAMLKDDLSIADPMHRKMILEARDSLRRVGKE